MSAIKRTIKQVQEAFTAEWMGIPGIEGTALGVCDDEPCIKIFTSRAIADFEVKIPSVIEGYRISIEQTDRFNAQDVKLKTGRKRNAQ